MSIAVHAYLSLIYESAIGQPKETTSLFDTLLFTVYGTITQLCILKTHQIVLQLHFRLQNPCWIVSMFIYIIQYLVC
jgi:hypothetical protein